MVSQSDSILRLKCDGTHAETRSHLSAKRHVYLNRRGRQFGRLPAAEACTSAVVMLDTPCSEVAWEYWLPTPFVSFPFTSPPVRHRVPSGFNWTLPNLPIFPLFSTYRSCLSLFSANTVQRHTSGCRWRPKSFEVCRLVNSYRRFEGSWCPYLRN